MLGLIQVGKLKWYCTLYTGPVDIGESEHGSDDVKVGRQSLVPLLTHPAVLSGNWTLISELQLLDY